MLAGGLALAAAGCAEPRPLPRPVRTVAQDGSGDYTSIQAAVDDSRSGFTIRIQPGTYREQISTWEVPDLHLIGTDRDQCILIDSSGAYSTPTLEMGSGVVRNLTIIEDHEDAGTDADEFEDQRSYSLHADHWESMIGRTLLIENCTLRNTRRAAIGAGLYQGTTITVRGCDIWSGAPKLAGDRNRGAIYFHNKQTHPHYTEDVTDQHLILERNTVRCDDDIVFTLTDAGEGTVRSTMDVLCVDNTFDAGSKRQGRALIGGTGFTADVTLHPDSRGNNLAALNA